MYILKRTYSDYRIAYYTADGWVTYTTSNEALDLSDVVRFTEGEAAKIQANNQLRPNEEFQWFGCYDKL